MTTCNGEFVSKQCLCLPDPMDPWGKICGYVNKQNGLVYPCSPGCCAGECNQTVSSVRFKIEPSQYSDILPNDFNVNLPQSDRGTSTSNTAPVPVSTPEPVTPVWQVLIVPFMLLTLILLVFFLS